MHFTYFAYEIHADVKPATIRALDYIAGTDEFPATTCSGYRAERGDCLLSARPEVVWLVEGMPLLSRFATITASKLRTHDDINGVPAHFTSISKLLDFGSTAVGIE